MSRLLQWLLGKLSPVEVPTETIREPLVIPRLNGKLLPFQEDGVRFICEKKKVLLADDMGLGKTIQALASLELLNAYPALVYCPASLKLNWAKEASSWLPSRSVNILGGTKPDPRDLWADITIINYEVAIFWMHTLLARKFGTVICDEAHWVKDIRSERFGAIIYPIHQAEVKLMLSGTPILNHPTELVALLAAIDWIASIGGYTAFELKYCGRGRMHAIRPERLVKLNKDLRQTCYLRREKSNVLGFEPKRRVIILVQVRGAVEYESTLAAIKAGATHPFTALEKLRLITARAKVPFIVEWIEGVLKSGEKLVVFAHHVEVQKAIAGSFPGCLRLQADLSQERRHEVVEDFQNNKAARLLVCSLKVAGIGLTLTAAHNVVFAELGWTPAEMEQAEDRVYRIGQDMPVTCWYFIGKDTVDGHILDILEKKRQLSSAVVTGTVAKKAILERL